MNDNGDAKFTEFSIAPTTGRKGTVFSVIFSYVSVNGTAPGEMVLDILTPDGIPYNISFISESRRPGLYSAILSLPAVPDPGCDPTKRRSLQHVYDDSYLAHLSFSFTEPCEQWLPGTYNLTLQICNGECGSKFPHSSVYDTGKVSFDIIE